ncbi:translation factor GUF1 homolog, mitochondrial isoform X2 [Condylostylus longicornis]|uniref:translation factor GUF1 homolog, mitochondrial isoform X2 n=1 Tax=Condylostylus longicornis TaxID=2530218 RepID=UPI00244DA251|nr:translation factor GUF1 homolog, mitochondrial isoform X2 [Condylostylus longicornis]
MIRIVAKTFQLNHEPLTYINYCFKRYCKVAASSIFEIPIDRIRNFSVIAHVDHGKSTLCDRLLEITGAISKDSTNQQVLDSLQVEKERGITVKAQTVSLLYKYKGQQYLLNLIDTPGHVDFSNEVARSLSICDGVVLLVDACQGVQAQTVANYYLAKSKNLVVVPVVNKIDLKNAKPENVIRELEALCQVDGNSVPKISAKLGTGVENVLDQVIERIPAPRVDRMKDFRGLVFDSWYDRYKGTLNLTYVHDGSVKIGDEIQSYSTGKTYPVKTISILKPEEVLVEKLSYWNKRPKCILPALLSYVTTAQTSNAASNVQQVRYYAKNKDKGKEKKKKSGKIEINETLINEFIDLEKYNTEMRQIVDQMKDDFIKNISLRSSVGSIESLKVTIDGTEHEIQEIAQISRKGTKTLIINMVAFPQYIPDVLKVVNASGMNLNPQQEGTTLYVPVPKVSKEHREQLSKNAKSLFVKCRIAVRQLQNDAIKKLKKQEKISQDDSFSIQTQLTAIADNFVNDAENILAVKQNELIGSKD